MTERYIEAGGRVVDEQPTPRRSRAAGGLAATVAAGNRIDALKAIRDKLGTALARAKSREAPALSRELRAVLAELETLGVRPEVTPLDRLADGVADELAAARSRRRADAETA